LLATLANAVLDFVAPVEAGQSPAVLPRASSRRWSRMLPWLDCAGLSLYFLDALTRRNAAGEVPADFLDRLRHRKQQNRERICRIEETFAALNRQFTEAGVHYAALKGFSLVPDYCADASLRALSDLDYFISASCLDRAQRILAEHGYVLKKQTAEEFAYWIPSTEPTREDQQYSAATPLAIELHLSLWNSSYSELPLICPPISIQVRKYKGSEYCGLSDPEIFLFQISHAFRHLMRGSVRPSWLLEIARFSTRRRQDARLWEEIARLAASDDILGEMMGLIASMAAQVFEMPVPEALMPWREQVAGPARIWMERYAREWLIDSVCANGFSIFPRNKLLLFLKEGYIRDAGLRLQSKRSSLYPWAGLSHLLERSRGQRVTEFAAISKRWRWLVSRLRYHAGANVRYGCELPRWRWVRRRGEFDGIERRRSGTPAATYLNGRLPT
jgi:putative nucleotidyltransferase-like protein